MHGSSKQVCAPPATLGTHRPASGAAGGAELLSATWASYMHGLLTACLREQWEPMTPPAQVLSAENWRQEALVQEAALQQGCLQVRIDPPFRSVVTLHSTPYRSWRERLDGGALASWPSGTLGGLPWLSSCT